ncbi:MAG TPA: UDP-N-acetylglucosamine 2-epimerase [Patescibacteria group bacterium]|jgi:UDP-N-acetylglucosamine 2-epimerase (non-hydrolysing)|nr:UDP-N-acetylglucosamine 2-epimerase [Patescibacteria group bacterium]
MDQAVLDKIKDAHYVHLVTIGTKPDIIKQAPIYHELVKRGETVLLCHTEQHYDYNYSGGVEQELGLDVDIRLGINGSWPEKTVQMIERFSEVMYVLLDQGKIPVPYVHGDTSTASAISFAAMLHKISCVHVEAGIRTLTPKKEVYHTFNTAVQNGTFDWNAYYKATQNQDNYSLGSIEPFPEQMNTRMTEPTSGFCAAPVEINKQQLIAEGIEPSKVEVVGNTITDATFRAIEAAKTSDIFSHFPQLADGGYLLMSIHRRENIYDRKRFTAIMEAVEELVANDYRVLFLSLLSTEDAIDKYGFREDIERMQREYPDHFIYSHAIALHKDLIALMQRSSAVVSDSGGFQEESNIVGIPHVTIRFGSDRSESFFAGSNIPAPPINKEFIFEVIKGAVGNTQMKKSNLYGKNVAAKVVDGVLKRLHTENGLFLSEEQRLGFE